MEEEEGEDVEAKGQCEPRLRVAEEHGTCRKFLLAGALGSRERSGAEEAADVGRRLGEG